MPESIEKSRPEKEHSWFPGEQPQEPTIPSEEEFTKKLKDKFKSEPRVEELIKEEADRIKEEEKQKEEEVRKEGGPKPGFVEDLIDQEAERQKGIGRELEERKVEKGEGGWKRRLKRMVGVEEKRNGVRSFFGVEFAGPRMRSQIEKLKHPVNTYLHGVGYGIYEPTKIAAKTAAGTGVGTLLELPRTIWKTAKLETEILWKLTKNIWHYITGNEGKIEKQVKFSDMWREFFPKRRKENKE